MRSEIVVSFEVLAFGSVANTIREDRLQTVNLFALHIQMVIDHNSGEALPQTLAHDASLTVIDAESLFQEDSRNAGFEPLDTSHENLIA
jgi:hypothetical protein